jgi:hypothetical protein
MQTELRANHEIYLELRSSPVAGEGAPLYRQSLAPDLRELALEAYTDGVLSGSLPCEDGRVDAEIVPEGEREPLVDRVAVVLRVATASGRFEHAQRFRSGRWDRRLAGIIAALRDDGTLSEDGAAHGFLFAERRAAAQALGALRFEPPPIAARELADLGVRELGEGELDEDRPIIVNERMAEEILSWTEAAGPREVGGAALGALVRLPETLPGTRTRIVTVLSMALFDERHAGRPGRVTFSPDALAEAAEIARLRGKGETVLTVFHSHGWGTECGNCNQSASCALAECTYVSPDDYAVLETLFPAKATVMPIAGRKLGAGGRRPVLEVHAWRGGTMRPLRWRSYRD